MSEEVKHFLEEIFGYSKVRQDLNNQDDRIVTYRLHPSWLANFQLTRGNIKKSMHHRTLKTSTRES